MPSLKKNTILPTDKEDLQITVAAMSDPDTFQPTEENLSKSVFKRMRGRPVGSGHKTQLTVRFDKDIVDAFRAMGAGWQTKMNNALREWLASH